MFDFELTINYLVAYKSAMRKTPQEIANLHPQSAEREQWLLDPATSIKELQQFVHLIRLVNYGTGQTEQQIARTALDVRISDEAAKSADKLAGQTDRLIDHTGNLVILAQAQKELAVKLDRQTNKLICLTWGIVGLSVALLAVAIVQICISLK